MINLELSSQDGRESLARKFQSLGIPHPQRWVDSGVFRISERGGAIPVSSPPAVPFPRSFPVLLRPLPVLLFALKVSPLKSS